MYEIADIRFYREELRDLAVAWLALSVAFTFFLEGDFLRGQPIYAPNVTELFRVFLLSMATVGAGFLLHELAHKIVAVQFGQIAAFRAEYNMLAITVASGVAGFLFAAPGAVYHRGAITTRQNGLVAVAGPVINLVLAAAFFVPFSLGGGFVAEVGQMGVLINIFLAAFNMVPAGPLDGKTVAQWHRGVFAAVFALAVMSLVGFVVVFIL
ncbi:Zn-dependent protease (includes SpoIVFB) [Halovenus aranensis]|uniref:Zn-dependent protease (Includes SpoIVFB) n=1 Tax=Halovenus aranensis TaxID=890420 RepID=A0A1G8XDZ7_9EURY|nr:metalloprotease [Halovenus aranensis]SDJ88617.1 Zn-dependent protease (includes SpoIVFB) [Halovenus aranensis]